MVWYLESSKQSLHHTRGSVASRYKMWGFNQTMQEPWRGVERNEIYLACIGLSLGDLTWQEGMWWPWALFCRWCSRVLIRVGMEGWVMTSVHKKSLTFTDNQPWIRCSPKGFLCSVIFNPLNNPVSYGAYYLHFTGKLRLREAKKLAQS